ncbi:3',5'-cyclic-nucleotide phosphodiesterase [Dyadobacter pollutisoli]|uniref:3',5'-cyclic-nucleotide phosphodiesterase n=1 Tax=Dyadobacter pollutisoli TaxID=2910158 RepID=A0A9E8N8H4_9BACT|nr:3',5'-cyclic-nucleotide phosphodiesterase [Dyadobacter pollutisoli]WAC10462.1 3',5'-cyclic-nucleotide phosphodiesterase [Dyadobacter pollutisoli]
MRAASFLCLLLLSFSSSFAQGGFKVVPLGVKGGNMDGNMSAYMVAPANSNDYVCFDGGSVSQGIEKAIANGVFNVKPDIVLKQYLKAYLISHPHLDHLSGMIINSIDDTAKNIYGFDKCIEVIKNHYFNWQSWPNMGSDGNAPVLRKYRYNVLTEEVHTPIDNTQMVMKAYKLSHSNPYESAAFLISNNGNHILYFGDTGSDDVEGTGKMKVVWNAVAPLVKSKKLKGVFLEVSYPNEQPDKKLYGHLTPKWFMKELNRLAELSGLENVTGLNVIVTHIKPTGNNEETIKKQLRSANSLGVNLIFPVQGVAFELK